MREPSDLRRLSPSSYLLFFFSVCSFFFTRCTVRQMVRQFFMERPGVANTIRPPRTSQQAGSSAGCRRKMGYMPSMFANVR